MKEDLLTLSIACHMFSENTSEIDFTMLERSGSESTGYFLAIAAARCPNV